MSTPPDERFYVFFSQRILFKHYVYNFISGWMNSKKEILAY